NISGSWHGGATLNRYYHQSITVSPVPEPSSIITLAGLLATFGFFGWRKKRKQAA
ncbi:MAG: PEP-CTERM sorting domain-containing protein, partial [Proteobacteria bacterium]|nr:PEP-CTERM sorting domain-containing protein [Pseudomonadota bacterium]